MQRGFVTPLRVESVDWKTWKILELFRFIGWRDGDIFDVEPGELTDFASVPWWSQIIVPRTGTWTKSAVLHDKMCNVLRDYYNFKKEWRGINTQAFEPSAPVFTSIDADAIFRENSRREGTGLIRAELLWFGVRCGSLWDAHRRAQWVRTLPRFTFDLAWILGPLVAIIWWLWP